MIVNNKTSAAKQSHQPFPHWGRIRGRKSARVGAGADGGGVVRGQVIRLGDSNMYLL